MVELFTHVHNVVVHNERSPLCLCLVPNSYLTDAAIASEEVVQVVSSYLIVQVFDKEDSVGPWR